MKLDPHAYLDWQGRDALRKLEEAHGVKPAWDMFFDAHPDFYRTIAAFAVFEFNPRSLFDGQDDPDGDGGGDG